MDGTLTGFRKMYVKLTKLLRSKERSSNRVMEDNRVFVLCIDGHNLASQKNISGANDVISIFVHVLSF